MSDERSGPRVPPDPDERRADRFAIGHDAFQFRFDFWQAVTDRTERRVTRILTNPETARDFARSLGSSLREYEDVRQRISGERENPDEE
jgi:hypothetical protein